ncbi:Conserved_hypothetical protein [Hexamita inflata]|uniref:Uncharacterized protein n=2 Tax=Hexamita inflata TaxID=28002 RepID=A0AA86QGZ3_9EUKA|nr:Conserved hypothetical protein [Hexamita inflata]
MNAQQHLQTLLERNTSKPFADFINNYMEDARTYPDQSSLYIGRSTQQDTLQNEFQTARSGWALPQSVWTQQRQQLKNNNRALRMLMLIQQFVEQQAISLPGDFVQIKFYNLIRQGKLLEASRLNSEQSQMIAGYLSLHCLTDSAITDHSDWLGHARDYAKDNSNDLLLRAIFGVLSGYDIPIKQYLKAPSKHDEIWIMCVCSINRFLVQKETINLQSVLKSVTSMLKTEKNFQGEYVSHLIESPAIYLQELINTNAEMMRDQTDAQTTLSIQRIILEQALFFVYNTKRSGLRTTDDIRGKIQTIQEKVIEVYTRQIIITLQAVQSNGITVSDEITLDDLDAKPQPKVNINMMSLKKDLELIPIISLSMQPSQTNDIFVMFSQTVICNNYFIQLLESSFLDKKDAIQCKLNILRQKLQLTLDYEPQQVEKEEIQDAVLTKYQLQEIQNLLFEGRIVISETISSVISVFVVHRIIYELFRLRQYQILKENSYFVQQLTLFVEKAREDSFKQQFKILQMETEIITRFLMLEKSVEEVFTGTDKYLLHDFEDIIEQLNVYENSRTDSENVVKIELICNPKAAQRSQYIEKLYKKIRSLCVRRYAQMCHWKGQYNEKLVAYCNYVEPKSEDELEVLAIMKVM